MCLPRLNVRRVVRCMSGTVSTSTRTTSRRLRGLTLRRVLTRCSVNTPTKTRGVGAGKAADLTYWEGAARMIASVAKSSKIVVEKSTVPVKTAEAIEKVLLTMFISIEVACSTSAVPARHVTRPAVG